MIKNKFPLKSAAFHLPSKKMVLPNYIDSVTIMIELCEIANDKNLYNCA